MVILVNEDLRPGEYKVDWDALFRASRIYYYKLILNWKMIVWTLW